MNMSNISGLLPDVLTFREHLGEMMQTSPVVERSQFLRMPIPFINSKFLVISYLIILPTPKINSLENVFLI